MPTKASPSSRAPKAHKTTRRPARPLPKIPSGEVALPEATPSALEELVEQSLRASPGIRLREVRQILERSGYQLKGGRRVAKTKRRLAGKLEAEVPAAAMGVQKEDKAGKRWAENLAGLVEKLRIEEATHEDEEMGDA
ncbi:hypothetical protein RUND412_004070 [Rhizina undulata]